jgi:polysaccharide pyruvyl transferase WcaK-like protein
MSKKKFLLYGHGGSYNHGAEAIVKCTIQELRGRHPGAYIMLSSNFPGQDKEFGVDADEIIGPDPAAWEAEKAAPPELKEGLAREMYAEALAAVTPDTTLLSIGGDNFCYPAWHRLAVFQKEAVRQGAKSILWSASVEPRALSPAMLEILNTYDEITVRESLSYGALKTAGLRAKLSLTKDVAFALRPEPVELPEGFTQGGFIGINFGPLVIRRESPPGAVKRGFFDFALYLLTETSYNIALIPHVVMPMDNDYGALSELYSALPDEFRRRVRLIGDKHSAARYKYIISQCAALAASRTHACIAAYSSGVPCLAVGYSVKAAGIAADLEMGEYVVKVSDAGFGDSLRTAFERMLNERGLRL